MLQEKKRILLVEDETDFAEIVRDYLQQADYVVELCHTGVGVVERVQIAQPQLILLDIMLPGVDGITICRKIRAFSEVPVIMLTARVDEIDRLIGYELGADDYICKPVNPREILARVKAVLRRLDKTTAADQAALALDESRLLAVYKGQRLDLTPTEFRLLKLLSSKEGLIFSRKQIKEKIYDDPNEASERSIDTCIKKLRKKIGAVDVGESPIRSIYGAGYKYEDI